MSKNESYNMPKHQKLWCAAFTKVFITYYQIRKNRNHTKYLAYCNSTQDKLLFFAWLTDFKNKKDVFLLRVLDALL